MAVIGLVFIVVFLFGLMSGVDLLTSLLVAFIWSVLVGIVVWLLSMIFGAGLLAVFGMASLFRGKRSDKP